MSWRAAIGGAMLAAVLCPVPAARAGTYEVVACAAGQGANRAWAAFNSDPALVAEDSCAAVSGGPADGLSARDRIPAPPNALAGSEAGWRFSAPSGTSITRLTAQYYLGQFSSGEWLPFIRTGEGTVLDSCVPPGGQTRCERGSATYDPFGPAATFNVNTQRLETGVKCTVMTGTCGNGVSLNAAWMALYAARVQVTDAVLPTLGSPSGPLWSDGFHGGLQTATLPSTDNVGIRSTWIAADGVVRGSVARACDYTLATPCTNEPGARVTFDTRSLSDGTHQLTMGADDPASNSSTVSRTVVTDNTPPTAPAALTLDGDPRRTTNSFTVHWQTPAGQFAPISAARWSLCATTGTCATGIASGAGIERLEGLTVPAGGDWDLRVWLEDAAGNASADRAAGPLRLSLVDPSASGLDPRVRIRSVRRTGRLIRISGVAAAKSGRVTVSVERRAGAHLLRVRGVTRIRDGRWSRRLRLTSRMARLHRLGVVVRFKSQHGYRAVIARRSVPR